MQKQLHTFVWVALSQSLLVALLFFASTRSPERHSANPESEVVRDLGVCEVVSMPCIENHIVAIMFNQESDDRLLNVAENAHASFAKARHAPGVPIIVSRTNAVESIVQELSDTRFSDARVILWMLPVTYVQHISERTSSIRLASDAEHLELCPKLESGQESPWLSTTHGQFPLVERSNTEQEFARVLECIWHLDSTTYEELGVVSNLIT